MLSHMLLTPEQLARYDRDGFLVLENFMDEQACDRLRERAAELVHDFDPQGLVSIFSTHEQTRTGDDYFLGSGDKIRFFFEENAFNPDGTLRQSRERSINKIGHALHDLDPVFHSFSRTPEVNSSLLALVSLTHCYFSQCTSSSSPGLAAKSPVITTRLFCSPSPCVWSGSGSRWKMRRLRTDVFGRFRADTSWD
jgi:hypothetical protein